MKKFNVKKLVSLLVLALAVSAEFVFAQNADVIPEYPDERAYVFDRTTVKGGKDNFMFINRTNYFPLEIEVFAYNKKGQWISFQKAVMSAQNLVLQLDADIAKYRYYAFLPKYGSGYSYSFTVNAHDVYVSITDGNIDFSKETIEHAPGTFVEKIIENDKSQKENFEIAKDWLENLKPTSDFKKNDSGSRCSVLYTYEIDDKFTLWGYGFAKVSINLSFKDKRTRFQCTLYSGTQVYNSLGGRGIGSEVNVNDDFIKRSNFENATASLIKDLETRLTSKNEVKAKKENPQDDNW